MASITKMLRSSREWPVLLKWAAIYWLRCPPECDVITMAIQVDIEGILCLSHVLHMTLLVLNQVDDILGFVSGRGSYMESLSSGCAPDGGACLDVVAGKAALAATTATSMGCLKEG